MTYWRVMALLYGIFCLAMMIDSLQDVKRDRQPTSVIVSFDAAKYAALLETIGIDPKQAKTRAGVLQHFVSVRLANARDKDKIVVLKDGKVRKRLFFNGIVVSVFFACFMISLGIFLSTPSTFYPEKALKKHP